MNQNTNNTQTIEDVCEFLNEQMQFFEQTAEVQRAIDNLMEGITLQKRHCFTRKMKTDTHWETRTKKSERKQCRSQRNP